MKSIVLIFIECLVLVRSVSSTSVYDLNTQDIEVENGNNFGQSVSIDGNTMVVGADRGVVGGRYDSGEMITIDCCWLFDLYGLCNYHRGVVCFYPWSVWMVHDFQSYIQ